MTGLTAVIATLDASIYLFALVCLLDGLERILVALVSFAVGGFAASVARTTAGKTAALALSRRTRPVPGECAA